MQCPTCEKVFELVDTPAPPFCSERCRTIDLGRWLDEDYALPELRDIEDEEDSEL